MGSHGEFLHIMCLPLLMGFEADFGFVVFCVMFYWVLLVVVFISWPRAYCDWPKNCLTREPDSSGRVL